MIEENNTLQSREDIAIHKMKNKMEEQRNDFLKKIDVLQQQVVTLQARLEDEDSRQKAKLEVVIHALCYYIVCVQLNLQ